MKLENLWLERISRRSLREILGFGMMIRLESSSEGCFGGRGEINEGVWRRLVESMVEFVVDGSDLEDMSMSDDIRSESLLVIEIVGGGVGRGSSLRGVC